MNWNIFRVYTFGDMSHVTCALVLLQPQNLGWATGTGPINNSGELA